MMSARVLARSISRSARCLPVQSARHNLRSVPSLFYTSRIKHASAPRFVAAFSTSMMRFESEAQGNQELVQKLASELAMEQEMRDPKDVPQHLTDYITNSSFKLHDTPGKEEVVMRRTYEDESIRISFSIDDLNHTDEDPDDMEDSSMMDEMDDLSDMPPNMQSRGANTKGSVNQGRTSDGNIRTAPDDSITPADRAELGDEEGSGEEEQDPSFSAHVGITVKRKGRGALQIEAIAQDGLMVIENIYYYKDAELADPDTTEKDWARRDLYTGPPFSGLDEDLQVMFEKYLEDRGINTAMALFIPDYIDFKEQREYLSWLEGVKRFVE